MKSLLTALANIGKKPPLSWTKNFQSYPLRLSELIRVLEVPPPNIDNFIKEETNFDQDWTNEFQGIACAFEEGNGIWFFSNKLEVLKVYWKPNEDLKILQAIKGTDFLHIFGPPPPFDWSAYPGYDLQGEGCDYHLGDLCYAQGLVFIPLEPVTWFVKLRKPGSPDEGIPDEYLKVNYFQQECSHLLAFSPELKLVGWAKFAGKKDPYNTGWCAYNPWDNFLYTSDDDAQFFYGYDFVAFFASKGNPQAWPKKLQINQKKEYKLKMENGKDDDYLEGSMQGVVFSPNGRIYVSQAVVTLTLLGDPIAWNNFLVCYETLTGRRLGTMKIERGFGGADENQGITMTPYNELRLVVLDNDLGGDEINIYHLRPPDPSQPI